LTCKNLKKIQTCVHIISESDAWFERRFKLRSSGLWHHVVLW